MLVDIILMWIEKSKLFDCQQSEQVHWFEKQFSADNRQQWAKLINWKSHKYAHRRCLMINRWFDYFFGTNQEHIFTLFLLHTCCLITAITGWDTDSSCAQVHFENTDINNKMATRAVEHKQKTLNPIYHMTIDHAPTCKCPHDHFQLKNHFYSV